MRVVRGASAAKPWMVAKVGDGAGEHGVGVEVEDALVLRELPQAQLGRHVAPALALVGREMRALVALAPPELLELGHLDDGPAGDLERGLPLGGDRGGDHADHVARRVEGADRRAEHQGATKVVVLSVVSSVAMASRALRGVTSHWAGATGAACSMSGAESICEMAGHLADGLALGER